METQLHASTWKKANITLINKGNSFHDVGDYRPIALQNVDMKIFAKMVKKEIMKINSKYNLIEESQFGFREDRGTAQPIHAMLSIIEDAKQNNQELHICLVDFSKAFDSVEWPVLKNIMKKVGYPKSIISFVIEYLKNRQVNLKTPTGYSEFFDISRGTPQGDPLSSIFFNIFINPLIHRIANSGKGYTFKNNNSIRIPCLAFADDLALIAKSKEELQYMLNIVIEFANMAKFPLNVTKTQYTSNVLNTDPLEYIFEDVRSPIPMIPNLDFKYLGVIMNLRLDYSPQYSYYLNKIRNSMSLIRIKTLADEHKITIINQIILPRVTYAMRFIKFEESVLEEIDTLICKELAKELNMQYNLRKEAVHAELGINSVKQIYHSNFVNSILFHGLNFDTQITMKTMEQRANEYNGNDSNRIAEVSEILTKHGLKLMKVNENKSPLLEYKPMIFNNNVHKTITKINDEKEWLIVATDGSGPSPTNPEGVASAITFGPQGEGAKVIYPIENNSFNAEVMAVAGALAIAPENYNILILTDCQPTIDLITKKKWNHKNKIDSNEYIIVKEIEEMIALRKKNGNEIKFEWIPSHLDRTEENKEKERRKKLRLVELQEQYGLETLDIFIKMNETCDKLAKSKRSKANYMKRFKSKYSYQYIITDSNSVPIKRQDIKKKIITNNRNENIAKYLQHKKLNDDLDGENTLKYNKKYKILSCKLHNGQIKTKEYVNTRLKKKGKLNYLDMTKIIINPTEYCEDKSCKQLNGTRLETLEHILDYCGNTELMQIRKERDEMISAILAVTTDKNNNTTVKMITNKKEVSYKHNEKELTFRPSIRFNFGGGNEVVREQYNKEGQKIKNRYIQEEKNKLIIFEKLKITSINNIQTRETYIDQRTKEDTPHSRSYYNTNFKNEHRVWLTKEETKKINQNHKLERNKKKAMRELMEIKFEYANKLLRIFYKNKYNYRKSESINTNKILIPNKIKYVLDAKPVLRTQFESMTG